MARRTSTEERLLALNTVEPAAGSLAPFLRDASSHVVAKAARIVRDQRVGGLDAGLSEAWLRFCEDPVRRDPGCVAKLAVLEALDAIDHDDEQPFREASRWVQREPAFEQPVDTAPPVRIRGALGLVRLRAFDTLAVLAEHLADVPSVQSAAAQALVEHGDPAGAALVRLRVMQEVEDGEVLTDCLCAVLGLDPWGDAVGFVTSRLEGPDSLARRAAALALGEMRSPGAFELLRGFCNRSIGEEREVARMALGLLRSDEAEAFLRSTDAG